MKSRRQSRAKSLPKLPLAIVGWWGRMGKRMEVLQMRVRRISLGEKWEAQEEVFRGWSDVEWLGRVPHLPRAATFGAPRRASRGRQDR